MGFGPLLKPLTAVPAYRIPLSRHVDTLYLCRATRAYRNFAAGFRSFGGSSSEPRTCALSDFHVPTISPPGISFNFQEF